MVQQRRDLRTDWVLDSTDLLKSLAAVVPPVSLDTAALVEALCPHGSQRRDLAFGLSLVTGGQGAGYISADVRIADFEGQAAILRIDLRGDKVRDLILKTWPHDLDRQRLRYETRDPALVEVVAESLANRLGRYPPPEVDPAQATAYETLMDPLLEHHYGTACYISGTPPEARTAIEALVASAQYGPVRSILRSPNPEARVYAAEALKRWERKGEAIRPADREAIEYLASQETPIFVCAGCMVYPESQDMLLARLEDVGDPQIFGIPL